MARPPKPPNPIKDQVEALAAINCTWEEIAAVTGIPISTAKVKFGTNYRKGKQAGRTNLKKRMYEVAMGGNIVMMIFLSKQMLGYTDKIEQKQDVTLSQREVVEIQWADETDAVKNALPDSASKTDIGINQPV